MTTSRFNLASGGIKAFFLGMLPNFEKMRIMEDLNSAFKELAITQEMYNLNGRDYMPLLDKEFKALDRELVNRVKEYRGDLVGLLYKAMTARLKEKEKLVDFVEEIYGPVVMKDALDYCKINMIRYLEGLTFLNTYARKFILVATNKRINDASVVMAVDRVDEEFVMDMNNIRTFAIMVNAINIPVKDIREAFEKLKHIMFKPETHDQMAASNNIKVDPLGFGMMPIVGTVVYHVGLMINLWHSRRQELAKEEKEKLSLQIILLKRKMEKETDEKEIESIKKQIEYYSNRANKIAAKLEDMAERG